MRFMRMCLVLVLMAGVVSCETTRGYAEGDDSEPGRAWNTMKTVLARHFRVETSRQVDQLVAYSDINSEGFEKYRTKIVGTVVLDEDDFWRPVVRVFHQVDMSNINPSARSAVQPRFRGGTINQPRYQWRTVSVNEDMEAQLRNEIDAELYGGANGFRGKFFMSPLPKSGAKSARVDPAVRQTSY